MRFMGMPQIPKPPIATVELLEIPLIASLAVLKTLEKPNRIIKLIIYFKLYDSSINSVYYVTIPSFNSLLLNPL